MIKIELKLKTYSKHFILTFAQTTFQEVIIMVKCKDVNAKKQLNLQSNPYIIKENCSLFLPIFIKVFIKF
jgi:hypothetical protein